MKINQISVVSCFAFVLIVSIIPASSAYVEKQNQSSMTKNVSIIGCTLNRGSCFSPCQTIVTKGDTVTWTNQDSIVHMVNSGSGQGGPNGWFSSSIMPPHGTFSHKFDRMGSFVYYDVLNPYTEGVVIVGPTIDSSYVHLAKSFFSNWCNR